MASSALERAKTLDAHVLPLLNSAVGTTGISSLKLIGITNGDVARLSSTEAVMGFTIVGETDTGIEVTDLRQEYSGS